MLFREVASPNRKTRYDIVAVKQHGIWVILDSRFPNLLFKAVIERSLLDFVILKEEFPYDRSRLDFLLRRGDREYLCEVKGCSLCEGGRALFPDSPTLRGKRHVGELRRWIYQGGSSLMAFVVTRPDAESLSPNEGRDPDFAKALRSALGEGLETVVFKVRFEEGASSIYFGGFLPLNPL